jgi:3'-phosphoadenosine 5'-phosphosulfate sulfotransferase (PAPS reductase)/FAD synthetase
MQLETINYALQKAAAVCNKYDNILVSVSGGSDSDVMLDLLLKTCPTEKCKFVFFDTGIEYQATKDHLDNIEKKYHIQIERVRAKVPVPLGCRKYGLPFISKDISAKINSLQNNGFDFKNDGRVGYEDLVAKYPKCKSALAWWCNKKPKKYAIASCKFLKEFMIANPPDFKISERCCNGAKKNPSHDYEKEHLVDLKCLGLRKSEGGIRSTKFTSCYEYDYKATTQQFRPIWHFTDEDKQIYCEMYGVEHSKLYTTYGFKRSGCGGCPFNSKFEDDLKIMEAHEPLLYRAVNNIFGKSYEYTRAYRKFKHDMANKTLKE